MGQDFKINYETLLMDCLKYFVAGDNIFLEPLFKYNNLRDGSFRNFICNISFTYDSDLFNRSLSGFARNYNPNGYFNISTCGNKFGNFIVENKFDPDYLNARVENFNIALKLTATFVCDAALCWCIFLDNDLDVFIVWMKNSHLYLFDKYFNQKNNDFYYEPNDAKFLKIVVNRMNYKKGFNQKVWTENVLQNNKQIFDQYRSQ